jgi:hypothetical protein
MTHTQYITTVLKIFNKIKQLAIKITSSLSILSLKPSVLEGFEKTDMGGFFFNGFF